LIKSMDAMDVKLILFDALHDSRRFHEQNAVNCENVANVKESEWKPGSAMDYQSSAHRERQEVQKIDFILRNGVIDLICDEFRDFLFYPVKKS
jgi:hypothetical protein